MAKSKPAIQNVQELTYEDALAELENIVAALEDAQHPLGESLNLFERGQALIQRCNALLEAAQLKVQTLTDESLVEFEETDE